jgi:nucleoside-triphosphatase THEP1
LVEHRSPKPAVAGSSPVSPAIPKIFLTGDPSCGKTTAICKLVERLKPHISMTGFYTEEIRRGGTRAGFQGVTLDGLVFELARVGLESDYRLGPYGITLEGLEKTGLNALQPKSAEDMIILDEVGKMESFSEPFQKAVLEMLELPNPVLATVASHGVGFVKKIRQHPNVELIRLTRKSRDGMIGQILRRLARGGIGTGR